MGTTANYSWPYPESSDFVADGATAIENLADAIDVSVHDLGQWQTFTSIGLLQPGSVGGLTIGLSRYTTVNNWLFWDVAISIPSGTAGIAGNSLVLNGFPIAPVSSWDTNGAQVGHFRYLDAGVQWWTGSCALVSGDMRFQVNQGGNWFGATPSIGVASGDSLRFFVSWEI